MDRNPPKHYERLLGRRTYRWVQSEVERRTKAKIANTSPSFAPGFAIGFPVGVLIGLALAAYIVSIKP